VIDKETVLGHLRHIHCGGQIGEVILTGALGATAIAVEKDLLVVAPELARVEPLVEPMGVPNLLGVIKAVEKLAPEDTQVALSFELERGRVVVATQAGRSVHFQLAEPRVIATAVSNEYVGEVLSETADEIGIPLPQAVIEGVLVARAILGADTIRLEPGEERGQVVVGNREADFALIPYPEFRSNPPVSAILSASVFGSVLRQVQDYTQSFLRLDETKGFVTVRDAAHLYVIATQDE
jgi:hypothetical protein